MLHNKPFSLQKLGNYFQPDGNLMLDVDLLIQKYNHELKAKITN